MNNAYYPNNNSTFPKNNFPTPVKNENNFQQMLLPAEQSYIENILRLNKGKKVRVHQTFPDSNEWRDLEFKGIIEQSGRDHIILSDPSTGVWQVLLMIYVDYISFDEQINYSQEFYLNN
ncbi:MAG: spore coat protein GerQ [Bacilli bacterium]